MIEKKRDEVILPSDVERVYKVHSGASYKEIKITSNHVGRKFGELVIFLRCPQNEKNMAKNTNPLTKNIQIKQSWNTIGLPVTGRVKHGSNELMKENFIKDLINGSFMKLGLLTSEIGISKNCIGENIVYWQYYPLNERGVLGVRGNGVKVVKLIQVLKILIELKEPTKSYKMVCIRAANKFVEGKILNDYINNMVVEDPSKLKYVVSTVIREYKMWSQGLKLKKHDSIINKGKNNR